MLKKELNRVGPERDQKCRASLQLLPAEVCFEWPRVDTGEGTGGKSLSVPKIDLKTERVKQSQGQSSNQRPRIGASFLIVCSWRQLSSLSILFAF